MTTIEELKQRIEELKRGAPSPLPVYLEGLLTKAANELESLTKERVLLREALQRIIDGQPAQDGSGGLFVPHFDGEGNEIGIENVDPLSVLQSVVGVAQQALTSTTPNAVEERLKELEKDKERLEHVMVVNHRAAKTLSDLGLLLNERPTTKELIQTLAVAINFHDRQAIDSAIAKESK